jgi:hypothetical protein
MNLCSEFVNRNYFIENMLCFSAAKQFQRRCQKQETLILKFSNRSIFIYDPLCEHEL